MEKFDVIVVGAGLGGLASASLLAQSGRKVLVVDKHNIPGGYATNFKRKDFTFDVSLHSFDGMIEGADSYECIKACGIEDELEFLPHKRLYRYRSGAIDLSVKERDLEAYLQQLAQLFPGEEDNLRRLFAEAERTYANVAGFLYKKWPFLVRLILTPFLFHRVLRYENTTVHAFFSKFTQNERLKTVLAAQWTYYGLPPQRLAFPYFSYPFIDYLKNGGYSIKGGSQSLSNALSRVIERHGGRIVLSSPVKQIHVDGKHRVTGITSKKTGRVEADTVIANISPFAVTELVGKEHFPGGFCDKLSAMKVSTSGFQVYLGLDCSLESLGISRDETIIFMSDNPDLEQQHQAMMENRVADNLSGWSLNFFSNIDPSLVPAGKASLGIFTLLGDGEWQSLSKADYKQRKLELTELLISKAEKLMPGLRAHIEVCEAGSPRTLTKFTANPQGAIYGFEQSIHQSGLLRRFRQKYPIQGLYQVGAWTFPGAGFIGTLLSARVLVDRYFSHAKPAVKLRAQNGLLASFQRLFGGFGQAG
ncbi:NAD(P)/FAD-dependent oxidoreductase [Undibacterium cyanobacteriorum]|uniref:NAD(P)/FAD-dependent oxidoreductase n=1 Tax=Undibacterium cyanobacteriorum TaxID=3073561 RepID=A0ABY9RMP1_9BURK|nr:NAD(P)/FAD-dependent oxidoreductase [Undibacterium sp. 20NA77.5]WMW81550.1 NAD(P)/FAD-dependent oxidoreductase [Undibacterium sp. 20NA77.5]